MGNIADVKVKFIADTSGYTKGVDTANRSNKKLEESSGSAGGGLKNLAGIATGIGAFVGLSMGIKDVYEGFEQAEKQTAITNARLEATQGVSGMTASAIDTLAHSLQNKTAIDENQIHSSENTLLSFTAVQNKVGEGNDIFNRATEMSLNMSTALGVDAPQAAKMLGLALQDPATGLTRLKRAGVTFTDAQKKQITAMEKSGNVMGAQKMILDSLGQKYNGVAAAVGDTTAGKIKIFMLNMREAGQKILALLMPALEKLSGWLVSSVVPAISAASDWIAKFIDRLQNSETVKRVIADIGKAFGKIKSGAQKSIGYVIDHWNQFKNIIIPGAAIAGTALLVMAAQWAISAATSMASAVIMAAAWLIALGPIAWVIAAVVAVATLIIMHWGQIKNFTIEAWGAVVGAIKSAWNAVKSAINTAITFVVDFIRSHWLLLIGIITGPLGIILALIISHWDQIKSAILSALDYVKGIISNAFNTVVSTVTGAWDSVYNAVTSAISNVISAVTALPGQILGALGDVGSMLYNAGSQIIQGLINGIGSMAGAVADKMKSIAGSVKDAITNPLSILSPSMVMHQYGLYIGQGLANGIAATQGIVTSAATSMISGVMPAAGSLASAATPAGFSMPVTAPGGTNAGAGGSSNLVANVIIENPALDFLRQFIRVEIGDVARGAETRSRSNLTGYQLTPR